MMPRSLLTVGLIALVIALAATGALSVLRADEVVEVFPLPADILDLPLPTGAAQMATVTPQATAEPASTPTAAPDSAGEEVHPTSAILQAGQNGYSGCTDTYIQSYLPAGNYCESAELYLVTSNKAAALLRFDLTNLPEGITGLDADATILKARLELYTVQGNEGVVTGIYLPHQAWDPCAVTWSTPWEQPGADGPADRDSEAWVEATVEHAEGWMAFDLTGLVQSWLDEPTRNYGIIIKSLDVNVASHHIFYSSEHFAGETRPRLTIEYKPAAPLAPPTLVATTMPGETPSVMPAATSTGTPGAVPTATAQAMTTPTLIQPGSPRVVEIHWRSEMNTGSTYPIRAIFRPETAEGTGGSAQLYRLSVRAQVTAPTFDIEESSAAEQVLEQPEDTLSWSWQVEPRVLGAQTLSLDLLFRWIPATSASSDITMDRGAWYQTKVIKITQPFPYLAYVTLLRNVLLLIGLAGIAGWYVLRRRTKDRPASDA